MSAFASSRLLLFFVVSFVNAALVFLVQPMIGKALLPLLGGTPAVWNTCLVFFQALLLGGYLYAHLGSRLSPRGQAILHTIVLALVSVLLLATWTTTGKPILLLEHLIPTDQDYPILPILAVLLVAVGPTFLILSATAPLLQRWYAAAGNADPYFLYAAGNAGSLLGLLAYPFAVEPLMDLAVQEWLWACCVLLTFALIFFCTLGPMANILPPPSVEESEAPKRSVFSWIALSAIPSALLVGVTNHLTVDIAPVPLFWVLPLALYLITFIVAFGKWNVWASRLLGRVLPALCLLMTVTLASRASEPTLLLVPLNLLGFTAICLFCHGELAISRPAASRLTAFYLSLSVGGVIGGWCAALLAPFVFSRAGFVEYPLALILATLLRPKPAPQPTSEPQVVSEGQAEDSGAQDITAAGPIELSAASRVPSDDPSQTANGEPAAFIVWADIAYPALLGAFMLLLLYVLPTSPSEDPGQRFLINFLVFAIPSAVVYCFVDRPIRYALGLVALLVGSLNMIGPGGRVLQTERNFFGVLSITETVDGKYRCLVHGTTLHGKQRLSELDAAAPAPLAYYHRATPIGRAMTGLFDEEGTKKRKRVGVVGLGSGALIAYGKPGQHWTFFEIDPAVIRIASDEKWFTFLKTAKCECDFVLGDARRKLAEVKDGEFDVLVIDAFSSDAIPVHLLTREALAIYMNKLGPDGILFLHLSNRYLELAPLVGRLAEDHEPPLVTRSEFDSASDAEKEDGKFSSLWVGVARSDAAFGKAVASPRWHPIRSEPGPLWTDRWSNLLGVWRKGN